jgi:hypothetical protein
MYFKAALLPISRALFVATPSFRHKAGVSLVLGGAGGALLLLGRPFLGSALIAFAAVPVSSSLVRKLEVTRLFRDAVAHVPDLSAVEPAAHLLVRLGVPHDYAAEIEARSRAGEEILIGEFDQFNRLQTAIGPLPGFPGIVVEDEEFVTRLWHNVQLVARDGVLAVRKKYKYHANFQQEAIALHQLSGVPRVPVLVAIDPVAHVLHQSFFLGTNLGGFLLGDGITVDEQLAVSNHYEDQRERATTGSFELANRSAGTLHGRVHGAFFEELHATLQAVHARGVCLRDVKYGNVLVVDGHPVLCDFDKSRAFLWRSLDFWREVTTDLHKFNYYFGTTFEDGQTFSGALRLMKSLAKVR